MTTLHARTDCPFKPAYVTIIACAACGLPARPPLISENKHFVEDPREQVIRFAEKAHDTLTVHGVEFDPDPVGFLRATYWSAGIDLFDAVAAEEMAGSGTDLLLSSAKKRAQFTDWATPGHLATLVLKDGSLMPVMVLEAPDASRRLSIRGWFADGPITTRVEQSSMGTIWDPFR